MPWQTRFAAWALSFALALFPALASAQIAGVQGFPPGQIPVYLQPAPAAGGYVGPGDLSLTATVKAWGAVQRCYSTSYTGNVAQIWDSLTGSTTETLLTCSAGGTINQTIHTLAVTCASGCVLKIMYDQSGANACGGSPCDWTAAGTAANWPIITLNYSGSRACATQGSGGSGATVVSPAITTLAQPFSATGVYIRTSGNANFDLIAGGVNPNAGILYSTSPNTIDIFAGSVPTATATENVLHSFQGVFNGSSSIAYVDTTATTGLAAGALNLSGLTLAMGAWGASTDSYVMCETGVWAGAFSSGDYTALGANQHGANGYSF